MPPSRSQKEKQQKRNTLLNTMYSGAAGEVVSRHGNAVKEHLVAYGGIDNETKKILNRSLKNISKNKVNANFDAQNIKQQAGFSAEIKEVARSNANRIIEGKRTRLIRMDDIGKVNDPIVDHVVVNKHGTLSNQSQMKFVGKNPQEAFEKLTSQKFEKYIDNNVSMAVPSDFYQGIKEIADKKLNALQRQINELRKNGKTGIALTKIKELEKIRTLKQNLRKSYVSNEEAIEARLNPEFSTAKDIAKIANRAGVEQAKWGAAIGGGVSMIRNVVAVCKKEQTATSALKEIAKDTTIAAAHSYTTVMSGSILQGSMQNSTSQAIRTLAKTNLPATVVTIALEAGKTLRRYFHGEIDGTETLEELGEKGTGLATSAMFAVAGQMAIPIPILGGMVGSMVGYALSSACYKELLAALKEEKHARQQRIKIEAECEEAKKMILEFRNKLENDIRKYLCEHTLIFQQTFAIMEQALLEQDANAFIKIANCYTEKLGGKPQFHNTRELESLMESSTPLYL